MCSSWTVLCSTACCFVNFCPNCPLLAIDSCNVNMQTHQTSCQTLGKQTSYNFKLWLCTNAVWTCLLSELQSTIITNTGVLYHCWNESGFWDELNYFYTWLLKALMTTRLSANQTWLATSLEIELFLSWIASFKIAVWLLFLFYFNYCSFYVKLLHHCYITAAVSTE